MLHSFRSNKEGRIKLRFLLDKDLKIAAQGKPKINLMLYHNVHENSIEFSYPWIKAIVAKLVFDDDNSAYTFIFNKNYMRFSKIVAEGWELIDIFRSLLQGALVKQDMYMVHGASIRLRDEGILIPSFGNTGKTTAAWMLAHRGAGFVTDEFAILDSENRCLAFPCSSLVSARLVKTANIRLTMRQRLSLKARDTRSKFLSTRFAPGGVKLYPDNVFETSDSVAITRLVFIQNGLEGRHLIRAEEAHNMLRAIQDYELNWRSNPYIIARSFFSPTVDCNEMSRREEAIMKRLVSRVRSSYIVSSLDGHHYESIENIIKGAPVDEMHTSDLFLPSAGSGG